MNEGVHTIDLSRDEETTHMEAVIAMIECGRSAATTLWIHAPCLRLGLDLPPIGQSSQRGLDPHGNRCANCALLHELLRLLMRRVIHEVLEDPEDPATALGDSDEAIELFERSRRRLL